SAGAGSLGVGRPEAPRLLGAQIPDGHAVDYRGDVERDLLGLSPHLNPAIGGRVLRYDEAHARIAVKVPGLHVSHGDHDRKPAVAPFMPDGGEQHTAITN